jgi:hypothetical protein
MFLIAGGSTLNGVWLMYRELEVPAHLRTQFFRFAGNIFFIKSCTLLRHQSPLREGEKPMTQGRLPVTLNHLEGRPSGDAKPPKSVRVSCMIPAEQTFPAVFLPLPVSG